MGAQQASTGDVYAVSTSPTNSSSRRSNHRCSVSRLKISATAAGTPMVATQTAWSMQLWCPSRIRVAAAAAVASCQDSIRARTKMRGFGSGASESHRSARQAPLAHPGVVSMTNLGDQAPPGVYAVAPGTGLTKTRRDKYRRCAGAELHADGMRASMGLTTPWRPNNCARPASSTIQAL